MTGGDTRRKKWDDVTGDVRRRKEREEVKEGQTSGEEARGGDKRRKKVWGCAHRCGEVKMKGYGRWWVRR